MSFLRRKPARVRLSKNYAEHLRSTHFALTILAVTGIIVGPIPDFRTRSGSRAALQPSCQTESRNSRNQKAHKQDTKILLFFASKTGNMRRLFQPAMACLSQTIVVVRFYRQETG